MIEKGGGAYLEAYRRLKFYIGRKTLDELKEEIMKIEDIRVFPYLLALGLSWELIEAVSQRWNQLRKLAEGR
jgi:hypothetical protein